MYASLLKNIKFNFRAINLYGELTYILVVK